jgi:hypothetical protein
VFPVRYELMVKKKVSIELDLDVYGDAAGKSL